MTPLFAAMLRAVADGDVIGDADLPAHQHAPADHDRAREPGLRGDDGALADLAVVADVDLRIELARRAG